MFETSRKWQGSWIWPQAQAVGGNETVLFRQRFELPAGCRTLRLHVSADTRYRLFVNGTNAGAGPCKGDHYRKYYETYELGEQLRPGVNTIAVKVIHYAPGGPRFAAGSSAIARTPWGGFILDGETVGEDGGILGTIATDSSWRCLRDESTTLVNESWLSGVWLGGVERADGALRPHGWELPEFDDSAWPNAVSVGGTMNAFGVIGHWPLAPRVIPHLAETPGAFARIVRSGGWPEDSWQDVLLPARSRAWIELDAGELTTGYLQASFTGGKGSTVRLLASECYERTAADGARLKGVRDLAAEDSFLVGDSDIYKVSGDVPEEAYEPFWFRTFRFVRLEIDVADEPLTLRSLDYRETGYPLRVDADFSSSDPTLAPLWEISVRTLKRCMHETYEDCPYYEQLQYTMDTALQMLFTYHVSGDDRLARKAIHDFHCSRLPDGMLQARYPTVEPQVIPAFALYWTFMLHDHYTYFGDLAVVRAYLPTADGVLEWFRRRIGADGLVGADPDAYWSFVDWVEGWETGVPGCASQGPVTVINLICAAALLKMAELQEAIGRDSTAMEYKETAERLNAAVRQHCWSEEEGLFRDGPEAGEFSQHAQLWAVLSGAARREEAAALMERTMASRALSPVSYSMAFFLFRALEEAGVYRLAFGLWDQWRAMVDLNLTTWAEEPNGNRSDCHAWGAAPLYEFPRVVLGIKPALPGFAKLAVEPFPGPLDFAEGSMATPQGLVRVRFDRTGDRFAVAVDGPPGVPLSLRLPDGTVKEFDSAAGVRETGALPGA